MSWGTELWDQFENLSLHTQKGIDFLERYGHFIRDRCTIEEEYATKLRNLVKRYQPKKKEEEDNQYSPCRAFKKELNEVNDQAGQREIISENLQANVLRELNLLIKEFKEDRKKYLQEGVRLRTSLATQIGNLERARKAYEKAFREAERASENYQKADADYDLSRAEVEKQRMNMTIKTQQSEEAKTEYAKQLQTTNEMQVLHYHTAMPEVFQHLQELDEKRIKNTRNYMLKSVEIERSVAPIIAQCLEGIEKAANEINEKEDTLLVIERYKSGFTPPGDFPFEDLSAAKMQIDGGNSRQAQPTMQPIHNHLTVKGTVSGGKMKKRVGIFGIFSSNKKLIEVCIALKVCFLQYAYSTNSPESGLGASRTSLPGSTGEEYYVDEVDAQPPLGTCKALYPFDATSEGSIPMYDGEELYMIELDQGDGWTRVRRISQPIEGFVPTSYIECHLYNT
ncbi:formin-binding protein 1 homolog [Copidosoma floridanum]|uniref:formin-binding protein 1 homolog n=1 Tax=Copidosoma floridanum TaxID=29053 RepID=UPI000C6F9D89|nr:formin-binding protein 1 homolog [Copidosoma floridanum]